LSSFSSSIIFFFGDEELGWMDDGMDDGTDGWKGRPPSGRLRILYIKIKKLANLVDFTLGKTKQDKIFPIF
jgi:hypothetical protein